VFFEAEDGIRVFHVTGVQTCALPIYSSRLRPWNPATMAMLPLASSRLTRLGSMRNILARVWEPSVMIPTCGPVSDTAASPKSWRSEERRGGHRPRATVAGDAVSHRAR